MNLQHHPDVALFLQQLGDPALCQEQLCCPLCGGELDIETHCGRRISALCYDCDFHAVVPMRQEQ